MSRIILIAIGLILLTALLGALISLCMKNRQTK